MSLTHIYYRISVGNVGRLAVQIHVTRSRLGADAGKPQNDFICVLVLPPSFPLFRMLASKSKKNYRRGREREKKGEHSTAEIRRKKKKSWHANKWASFILKESAGDSNCPLFDSTHYMSCCASWFSFPFFFPFGMNQSEYYIQWMIRNTFTHPARPYCKQNIVIQLAIQQHHCVWNLARGFWWTAVEIGTGNKWQRSYQKSFSPKIYSTRRWAQLAAACMQHIVL